MKKMMRLMRLMRSLQGELEHLPVLVPVGLAIVAAGGSLDMLLHAPSLEWLQGVHEYLHYLGLGDGAGESFFHLVTLIGLLISAAGLVTGLVAGKRTRTARWPQPEPVRVRIVPERSAPQAMRKEVEDRTIR